MAQNNDTNINFVIGRALPRIPTLEAGRSHAASRTITNPLTIKPVVQNSIRWLRAQLADREDLPEDSAQRLMRSAARELEVYQYKSLAHLLHDYTRIKDRSGYLVSVDLIQVWFFEDGTVDNNVKSKVDMFRVEQEATFSEVNTVLLQHLSLRQPNALRVIALGCRSDPSYDKQIFSARHKLWATLRGRLGILPFAPASVVRFLVSQSLGIREACAIRSVIPDVRDARRKQFIPPSNRIIQHTLDPMQLEGNHIVLRWQGVAPRFKSDIDTYIWEPYRKLPPSYVAEIWVWLDSVKDVDVVMIDFSHCSSIKTFTGLRNDITQNHVGRSSAPQVWTRLSELLLSIHALLQVVVAESTYFLQECSVELDNMALKARESPSSNKLQYLLHLDDCRVSACKGLTHSLEVLTLVTNLRNKEPSKNQVWDAGISWDDRCTVLEDDLKFLVSSLTAMSMNIQELQQVLHGRLDMTHNRRNFVLTVVAAVYLPLSFTTSFFGMNMNTSTVPNEDGFSKDAKSWIDHSPQDVQNATKALASTINTSGTLSYSWKTFAITAVCLVLTLPLSLTVGGIVRLSYRSATRYVTYWRWLMVLGFLGFFYVSTFSLSVSWIFTKGKGAYSVQLMLYCISNGLWGLYAFNKAASGWRKQIWEDHTERPLFWSMMTALILTSLLLDYFVNSVIWFPLTLIPWFFMGWVWLLPRLRRVCQARRLWC